MTVLLQLGGIAALLTDYGTEVAVAGWFAYQMYWPYSDTKLQSWFGSIQTRLAIIETVQIALASVIGPMDEKAVKELHDHDDLDPTDVMDDGSGPNPIISDQNE